MLFMVMVLILTNVPAVITGNISVNNATIGGTLHVGGITTVVGYTHFKDDVSVSGNVHIGGNYYNNR